MTDLIVICIVLAVGFMGGVIVGVLAAERYWRLALNRPHLRPARCHVRSL